MQLTCLQRLLFGFTASATMSFPRSLHELIVVLKRPPQFHFAMLSWAEKPIEPRAHSLPPGRPFRIVSARNNRGHPEMCAGVLISGEENLNGICILTFSVTVCDEFPLGAPSVLSRSAWCNKRMTMPTLERYSSQSRSLCPRPGCPQHPRSSFRPPF